jgi:hypothetical protein
VAADERAGTSSLVGGLASYFREASSFYDGQAVELISIDQLSGRGIVFDAGGTKPLADEFFAATQTPSLFPVDDDRRRFRSISGSHGLASSISRKISAEISLEF